MCVSVGFGGLSLSIEGPSKVDIQTEDLEDGTCGVTYCPTEPGNYIVSIRFAEEHVPGKSQLFSTAYTFRKNINKLLGLEKTLLMSTTFEDRSRCLCEGI